MDEKTKEGYKTAGISLLFFAILLLVTINNVSTTGWNFTSQILSVFTGLLGVLGAGSLLKPDSFGAVAAQILKSLGGNEEEKSD